MRKRTARNQDDFTARAALADGAVFGVRRERESLRPHHFRLGHMHALGEILV